MDQMGLGGDFSSLKGRMILDRDGDVIGRIQGFYPGKMVGGTDWCVIAKESSDPGHHLLPLADCELEAEHVKIPYTRGIVSSAPTFDLVSDPSLDDEKQLFQFYTRYKGWGPKEKPTGPEAAEGGHPTGWGPGEDPIGPEMG